MVLMKPCAIPNLSCKTFAIGARQLVVQLAFETITCFSGSKSSSFTPMQIVTSGFFAGALISTLFAPPLLKCSSALSRLVKNPVDSSTTSTSKFFPRQGRRVALLQNFNFVPADDNAFVIITDLAVEFTVHRVPLE